MFIGAKFASGVPLGSNLKQTLIFYSKSIALSKLTSFTHRAKLQAIAPCQLVSPYRLRFQISLSFWSIRLHKIWINRESIFLRCILAPQGNEGWNAQNFCVFGLQLWSWGPLTERGQCHLAFCALENDAFWSWFDLSMNPTEPSWLRFWRFCKNAS